MRPTLGVVNRPLGSQLFVSRRGWNAVSFRDEPDKFYPEEEGGLCLPPLVSLLAVSLISQLAGEWVRGMLDPAQRPGSAVRVRTGGGIRVADGGTGGGAGGLRTDPLQGAGRRAQQLGPGDLVDIVQRVAELGHRLHVPGTAPQGVYLNKQVDCCYGSANILVSKR
jgi:hypothetical protein